MSIFIRRWNLKVFCIIDYIAWFCARSIILDGFNIAAWLINSGGQNALYKFCEGHAPPVPTPM